MPTKRTTKEVAAPLEAPSQTGRAGRTGTQSVPRSRRPAMFGTEMTTDFTADFIGTWCGTNSVNIPAYTHRNGGCKLEC